MSLGLLIFIVLYSGVAYSMGIMFFGNTAFNYYPYQVPWFAFPLIALAAGLWPVYWAVVAIREVLSFIHRRRPK